MRLAILHHCQPTQDRSDGRAELALARAQLRRVERIAEQTEDIADKVAKRMRVNHLTQAITDWIMTHREERP